MVTPTPISAGGIRVIAPDQRGYNLSKKPKGVENYMQEVLVSDIIALADHFGFGTFNLAGHDFGGIVSWYGYFFKLPFIPELVVKIGDWKMLEETLEDSFTENEINEYKRAWSQKGANKATINWYRGLFKQDRDQSYNIIDVPTLVAWGKADPHIMWEQAEPSAAG